MRHDIVTPTEDSRIDCKGLGYIASILSVFFLGAVAWPKASDPAWVLPALVAGMAMSIVGMGLRYISHLQQLKEMRRTKAQAQGDR